MKLRIVKTLERLYPHKEQPFIRYFWYVEKYCKFLGFIGMEPWVRLKAFESEDEATNYINVITDTRVGESKVIWESEPTAT